MNAVGASLRRAAPALVGYAVARLLGLVGVLVWARAEGVDPYRRMTGTWDAVWYSRIAEQGYGHVFVKDAAHTFDDRAFFPLFPGLMRAVATVTPLDVPSAGLVVSWVAALAAAWGIFAVGELLCGRRVGIILAVLWGVLPNAVLQTITYTESLFTALAAWCLFAVLTHRWEWAAALAVLAGLTRPTAVAVVAAVWIGAAVVCKHRLADSGRAAAPSGGKLPVSGARTGSFPPVARRTTVRPALAALIAPLGLAAYLGWVALETGEWDGYLEIQRAWGTPLHGEESVLRRIGQEISGPAPWLGLGIAAGLAVVFALLAVSAWQRQPWPLVGYAAVQLVLIVLTVGHVNSIPRLLIPAFPLLLPVATTLARLRYGIAGMALGALTVVSVVYGGYLLAGTLAPP